MRSSSITKRGTSCWTTFAKHCGPEPESGTTNAHESTRIKKRGSTENTKNTEKNTVLPSVFFRAFRGQEKRNLRVIEIGKVAKPSDGSKTRKTSTRRGICAPNPKTTNRGNLKKLKG